MQSAAAAAAVAATIQTTINLLKLHIGNDDFLYAVLCVSRLQIVYTECTESYDNSKAKIFVLYTRHIVVRQSLLLSSSSSVGLHT